MNNFAYWKKKQKIFSVIILFILILLIRLSIISCIKHFKFLLKSLQVKTLFSYYNISCFLCSFPFLFFLLLLLVISKAVAPRILYFFIFLVSKHKILKQQKKIPKRKFKNCTARIDSKLCGHSVCRLVCWLDGCPG